MIRTLPRIALLGATLAATGTAAQEGCEFGNRGNDTVVYQTLPGMGRVAYIKRPHFVCERGTLQIFADTAVSYQDRGMSHLMGRVRYVETGRELRANEARYFSNEGRLQANGRVSVRDDAQGSSIENGDLVYLLQTSFRPVAEMTVTTGADGVRPRAILTPPPDTTRTPDVATAPTGATVDGGPSSTPYEVVADRLYLRGSGYFTARGTVEIERDSLRAFADSAEYDRDGGDLVLVGAARLLGDGYELSGRRIDMSQPGGSESEVHALREARLAGEDLLLTSAQIRVFLLDDALDRLVATPLARRRGPDVDSLDLVRPVATVSDFVLTADSLELDAPNERVERVFAAGSARSVSTARDSLNVEGLPDVARSDWLEGDTVVVIFAPSSAGEGARTEVREIVARLRARSLYRLEPNDSTARVGVDPPAVHYVTGREIRIVMNEGQVESMHVVGQTQGVHLEPLRRAELPDSATADSIARARTDSIARARVDTLRVDGVFGRADARAARDEGRPDALTSPPGEPDDQPANRPNPDGTIPARPEEVQWIRR